MFELILVPCDCMDLNYAVEPTAWGPFHMYTHLFENIKRKRNISKTLYLDMKN